MDSSGRQAGIARDKSGENAEESLNKRKDDATSDETLSDLEEVEEVSGSTGKDLDPGPSPDGALDQPGEIKKADPV